MILPHKSETKSDSVTNDVYVPKLHGIRQADRYRWQERSVTKNAPFATNDTPESRVRIIGSRLIALEDSPRGNPPSRATSGLRLTPIVSPQIDQHQFPPVALNQLPIVPSIPSAPPMPSPPLPIDQSDRLRDAIGEQTGINTQLIGTQFERFAFPPRRPGAPELEPWEEQRLRSGILTDLGDYRDTKLRLKDIYVELAGIDRRLTGTVGFTDLGYAFNRCNVPLSVPTLRELCCAFVSDNDATLVNYEKVLSFIASSLQQTGGGLSVSSQTSFAERNLSSQASAASLEVPSTVAGYDGRGTLNPITGEIVNYRRTTNELLMGAVNDELSKAQYNVNFDEIWQTFAMADKTHNNSFTFAQMKSLADASRIPLSDSVLEQLIDRCHKGNGYYGWQQFLTQLSRFLPQKTGHPLSGVYRSSNAVPLNPTFDTKQYKGIPNQMIERTVVPNIVRDPRLESFQDLSRALHRSDVSGKGRVSSLEARWLTKEYSGAFGLGFSEDQINSAIAQCADVSGSVPIEQFLQLLSSRL